MQENCKELEIIQSKSNYKERQILCKVFIVFEFFIINSINILILNSELEGIFEMYMVWNAHEFLYFA